MHIQADAGGKAACHFCQIRSFATHADYPISIVNETDDGAVLHPDFRFIERSILGRGVEVAEESFRTGCECVDDEDCMYSACLCLEEMAPDSDEGGRRPQRPAGGRGRNGSRTTRTGRMPVCCGLGSYTAESPSTSVIRVAGAPGVPQPGGGAWPQSAAADLRTEDRAGVCAARSLCGRASS